METERPDDLADIAQLGLTLPEAKRLLALIHNEKIRLFYAHIPARFGVINPDADDPVALASDEHGWKRS